MGTRIYHTSCLPPTPPPGAGAKKIRPCKYSVVCAGCNSVIEPAPGRNIAYYQGDKTEPVDVEPYTEAEVLQVLKAQADTTHTKIPSPQVEDQVKDQGSLGALLAREVLPHLETRIRDLEKKTQSHDVDELVKLLQEKLDAPIRFEIKTPDGKVIDAGRQHCQFQELAAPIAAGLNIWITGPAGAGKTTAWMNMAKSLGKRVGYSGQILDPILQILGYRNANGDYIPTMFRDFYENGGVFAFEEIDGSDPNAALTLNPILENGHAAFPDGMVKRHPDFVCIATGNALHGATHEYVGRFKPDAAFLNRWVVIDWQYDEDLERDTCGNQDWAKYVQKVRRKALKAGLRCLITPRASYYGAKLIAAGCSQEMAAKLTMGNNMTREQWDRVS